MQVGDRVMMKPMWKYDCAVGTVKQIKSDGFVIVRWDGINGDWHYTPEQAERLEPSLGQTMRRNPALEEAPSETGSSFPVRKPNAPAFLPQCHSRTAVLNDGVNARLRLAVRSQNRPPQPLSLGRARRRR